MRIAIADGVRLYVDVDGAGLVADGAEMRERPTVVLLHGGPGLDHTTWKVPAIGSLTDVAQLVYVDQRGHGRSDRRTSHEWNLDVWADDVVRLCDALGVEHPIVYGASFGGFVAQRYLARHPEHPAKVILACTAVRLDVERTAAAFARVGGEDAGRIARRFWEGDPDVGPDYFSVCMPLYTSMPFDVAPLGRTIHNPGIWTHFVNGEQQTMDLEAGLARAQCPVLVLGGELDPVFPVEASETVAAALPAQLLTYHRLDGASHIDVMTGPEAVELIRSFIMSGQLTDSQRRT
jgi:proline iminopeptidase